MISRNEFKSEVPSEIWENITQGDESLGDRFLDKARAWMAARLYKCNISSWDENEDIIKQILICRALYEMYAYVEKETLAFDKREAAEEMLKSRFGSCIDEEDNKIPGAPIVGVKQGRNFWEGF